MTDTPTADRRGILGLGLGLGAAVTLAQASTVSAATLQETVSTTGWLKVDILSRRRDDMTHAQYLAHWRDVHAPLFRVQPIVKQCIRRYVQSRIIGDRPLGLFDSSIDGIVQLWFDDLAGFRTYYASDNYRDVIQPDEKRFTDADRCELVFSHETVIIA
jgi:uncharacterized protein (TIGR02118 family)